MKTSDISDRYELYRSGEEDKARSEFAALFRRCPLPQDELMANLGMFLSSKNLARILFFQHIYQQIVDVQGVVMEFGTRWGQNLSLFAQLRGIYEPFNRHRKIIGFDTFEGFLSMSPKDLPEHEVIRPGGFAVPSGYEKYLEEVMAYQEKDNPLSHVKKFEIRKGDATVEIRKYLTENPQTVIALAYFDMDIYEPTKECLTAIRPHLVKGSLLGFDELNDPDCPGETIALKEVFGLNGIRLRRLSHTSRTSYFIVE